MNAVGDDPSQAEAAQKALRARSKQLLGGWYRAEVARAISDLSDRQWTLAEVEQRVQEVPRSCVNKEVATLIDRNFVIRHGRNDRGQYVYTTAGLPEYWAVARALTEHATHAPSATVVAMRSTRGRMRARE